MKRYVQLLVITATILLANLSEHSLAVQLPEPIGNETKLRTYVYSQGEIYEHVGHYMYHSFIQFSKGETVKTISMGDTTAWQIATLDNRLFLKPIAKQPQTNMTVITNKRIYNFILDAEPASNIDDKDLTFNSSFIYPEDEDKNMFVFNPEKTYLPDLSESNLEKYNFDYEVAGQREIIPDRVFDDGTFTYMEFGPRNKELPAIFIVDEEGYETLTNFKMVGSYATIETVGTKITLRSGGSVACIFNMNPLAQYR